MSGTTSKSRLPKPTFGKYPPLKRPRAGSHGDSTYSRTSQSHNNRLPPTGDQIARLKQELAEVRASENTKVEYISQLEVDLEVKHSLLQELESTPTAQLQATISELKQDLAEKSELLYVKIPCLEKTNQDLEAKLQERDRDDEDWAELLERVDEAENALKQHYNSLPSLQLQVKRAEKEDEYHQEFKDQTDELDKQLNDAVVEGKLKDRTIEDLQKRVKNQEYEIKDLEFKLQDAKRQSAAAAIYHVPLPLRADTAVSDDSNTSSSSHTHSSTYSSDSTPATTAPVILPIPITATPNLVPKIEIHVSAATPSKLGLLSRLRGIVQSDPDLDIRGPPELATALRTRLDKHHADHYNALQEIKDQKAHIISLERRSDCIDPAHKNVRDTIAAHKNQLEMTNILLGQYGARLREKDEREMAREKMREGLVEEKIEMQMGEEEKLMHGEGIVV